MPYAVPTRTLWDMHPALDIPPELLRGPFTRNKARTLGITPVMLRGRRFTLVMPRVYVVTGTELSQEVLCRAACLAVRGSALSHHSATLAEGLPTAIGELEVRLVHLTTPNTSVRPDRTKVTCHFEDLPADHVVQTPWGPATSPARTFLDRANELCLEDLVALGDAILARGLASPSELAAIVQWAHTRRGVVKARLALPLLDGRARSAMESWTRVKLVMGGCPAPEVNAAVYDGTGTWIAECDLVWRAARLIVEYDGIGHLEEAQRRKDLQRRNLLTENGWTVLHVTADDVLRWPWTLINQVNNFLAQASAA